MDQFMIRTRGRILHADRIPSGDEPPERPQAATPDPWQAFLQHLD
jgi:hypothetical protein